MKQARKEAISLEYTELTLVAMGHHSNSPVHGWVREVEGHLLEEVKPSLILCLILQIRKDISERVHDMLKATML